MLQNWKTELLLVLSGFGILLLGGVLTGHTLLILGAGGWIWMIWYLFNFYRLEHWLQEPKNHPKPIGFGLWHSVFDNFEAYHKRRRKFNTMLKRFRKFSRALPDAMVILNADDGIEWSNKAALNLLGIKSKSDQGRHIGNVFQDAAFDRFLANKIDKYNSVKLFSPVAGETILRLHIVPYAAKDFLLIARDITQLDHLEQIRSDFVSNFSHELRTPLTVISGFIETMETLDGDCAGKWQRPLYLMSQQTRRMQNIVNDLLLLSKLDTAPPPGQFDNSVNVPALLATVCQEAEILSGDRQHDIIMEIDDEIHLKGVEQELFSAFSNLVFNAVHYTPPKSRIFVRWYATEKGAYLEVQDTGEGIPKKHLKRLTERFYRVDTGRSRDQGGTGLGLAIVKHALNRHQAVFHIESQMGIGSTFSCFFPAIAVIHAPPDAAAVCGLNESTKYKY